MTLDLYAEARLALCSLLFGAFAGIYYDIFGFFRSLLPSAPANERGRRLLAHVLTFFLDFLCVLSLGALFVLFLYELHDGVFRFYTLPPLLLGAVLYAKTARKAVRFLLLHLSFWIKKLIYLLFHPLFAAFGNIFLPFLQKNMKKPLSRLKKCVKIKSNKHEKQKPHGQRNIKTKESYGKTKRA